MNKQPRILVAEDDFEDRYFMSLTFTELGHQDDIKFVEDGTLLISYLAEAGSIPVKLIILDLNMPRLNGTETLRLLKNNEEYCNIPVVIFSTSVNMIEKAACMALGAKEYITKPSKYADYIDTCNRFYAMSEEYAA